MPAAADAGSNAASRQNERRNMAALSVEEPAGYTGLLHRRCITGILLLGEPQRTLLLFGTELRRWPGDGGLDLVGATGELVQAPAAASTPLTTPIMM
jgi:hypothetical protein